MNAFTKLSQTKQYNTKNPKNVVMKQNTKQSKKSPKNDLMKQKTVEYKTVRFKVAGRRAARALLPRGNNRL